MKIRFIVPVALLFLPVAAGTQSMGEQQRIREDIRAEVGRLITATNYDVMATLGMYVPTSRVTSINDAEIVKGWNGLRQQTEAAVTSQGSFFIRLGNVDVTLMGPDHALAFASMSMEYPSTSGRVNMPGSMTLAYERTPEGWKIVHEHYSTGLTDEALASMANQASSQGDGLMGFLSLLLAGYTGGLSGVATELLSQYAGETCRR
jgi:ketosteroid isomerase-like protein